MTISVWQTLVAKPPYTNIIINRSAPSDEHAHENPNICVIYEARTQITARNFISFSAIFFRNLSHADRHLYVCTVCAHMLPRPATESRAFGVHLRRALANIRLAYFAHMLHAHILSRECVRGSTTNSSTNARFALNNWGSCQSVKWLVAAAPFCPQCHIS